MFSFVIGSETEVVIRVDAKIEAIVHFDWISPNKKIILNSAIKKKQKNYPVVVKNKKDLNIGLLLKAMQGICFVWTTEKK